MKGRNHILALAVGLAGGVAAQDALAAASIYGQLNVSLDSLDNGTDSALNISSNSSRIGFKGDNLAVAVNGDSASAISFGTIIKF